MNARAVVLPILCVAEVACGASHPAAAPGLTSSKAADGARHAGTPHDFDFELGTWHTHLRRLVHPLTGSTTWVTYDGTSRVRPVWNGQSNLVELDVAGPAGHIVGLSLRLFDPDTRTWSLNFARNCGRGPMAVPAVGEFKDGRGEFFDRETLGTKPILVRSVIRDVTPASYTFEQAFSQDDGATWEVNWVARDTRVAAPLSADAIDVLLASPDRTDADRKLDATRHPAELLSFFGVGRGMTVRGSRVRPRVHDRAPRERRRTEGEGLQPGRSGALQGSFLEKAWDARLQRPVNGVVVPRGAPGFDDPPGRGEGPRPRR